MTRTAQDFVGSADRWPGGVQPNGLPILNAENDAAVNARIDERQKAIDAQHAILELDPHEAETMPADGCQRCGVPFSRANPQAPHLAPAECMDCALDQFGPTDEECY